MSRKQPRHRGHSSPQTASGFTLVELMIGTTVSLWLLLGAVQLMGHHLGSYRAQVRELRLNQELRAAIDVMARDLKRLGHWDEALKPFTTHATNPDAENPFTTITLNAESLASGIEYAYARSDPTPAAAFGFRRLAMSNGIGILQMKNAAGGWQPLTDPAVINITRLTIAPVVHTVELWPQCRCRFVANRAPACEATELQAQANRPRLEIRRLVVAITGTATADSGLLRTVHEHIHLRNARLLALGNCPVP